MSAELCYEDLAALALPDIRTIMQKTHIEDHETFFAGPNSALRDKLIRIHLEWVGNFTDYRAEKNQRAFRELEIASAQRLKKPADDALEDAKTRILTAARAAAENNEISWPPRPEPVAPIAQDHVAAATPQPTTPSMPEELAALLAQPALNLSDSELVDLFSGLAIIARTKGILALDQIVPTCRDWVLRVFLNDVLNGLVPTLVTKLGETHIEALAAGEKTRCAMIVRGVECINDGLHPFIVQDMMHAFFAFTAAGESIANPPLDSVVNQMVELAEKAYLEGINVLKDETFHDEPLLKEGIALMLAHKDPTDPPAEGDQRTTAITDHLHTLTNEWMVAYEKRLRSILVGVQCIQAGEEPALIAERLNDL